MSDYVIDASVVVSLFVVDAGTPAALKFFQQLGHAAGPTFYAPDALYYETVSAMRKHELRHGYNTFAEDAQDLVDLPLRIIPARELAIEAVAICQARNVSPYDSFYLALSHRLNISLITGDERLVRAMQGAAGFDVRSVSSL